jgi:hypothetical protein
LETAQQMIKDNGFKSFWQGVMPALILVANPIIQYTVFEKIKARIAKTRALSSFDFFLLGAISKLAATSITYPYMYVFPSLLFFFFSFSFQRLECFVTALPCPVASALCIF